MAHIAFQNVSYSYADDNETLEALSDVSFEIADGEFVCLVGHSGCGKSTLLSLLAGLSKPTQGCVLVDGAPVVGPAPSRSLVFQNYSLFPWLTVLDNVVFAIRQTDKTASEKEADSRARELLGRVGMSESLARYPYQLSGGMQQRVAIARALAIDADIMLFDEPFGALDPQIRAKLQNLLLELWDNCEHRKTVVFVTHDIDEAMLLADRVLFMVPKRVIKTFALPYARPRDNASSEEHAKIRGVREEILRLFEESAGGEEL